MSWKKRANYWSGQRALGGTLRLSEESLEFRPHALERLLGGRAEYFTALGTIREVECATVGAVPRKRMIVRTEDKPDALFLVPHVEQLAEDIREAVDRARGREGA